MRRRNAATQKQNAAGKGKMQRDQNGFAASAVVLSLPFTGRLPPQNGVGGAGPIIVLVRRTLPGGRQCAVYPLRSGGFWAEASSRPKEAGRTGGIGTTPKLFAFLP